MDTKQHSLNYSRYHGFIVQWIEHLSTEQGIYVRVVMRLQISGVINLRLTGLKLSDWSWCTGTPHRRKTEVQVLGINILRGREVVSRKPHKLEIVGSNPTRATQGTPVRSGRKVNDGARQYP